MEKMLKYDGDEITSSFCLSFWISSLTGRYAAVVHRFCAEQNESVKKFI
jgi:hypothetical protein